MSLESHEPQYEAIPTNPQSKYESDYSKIHEVQIEGRSSAPRRLDSLWRWKILRACLDSIVAAIVFLYVVFGFYVLKNDGKVYDPGNLSASQATLVVTVSKYVFNLILVYLLVRVELI